MKRMLTLADQYMKRSDWKDLALLKTCLFSMGVAMGVTVPKKIRKTVGLLFGLVAFAAYVPLMIRFIEKIGGFGDADEV